MKKKRRNIIIAICIFILILVLLIFIIFNYNKNLTGKAIFIQPMPTDCSNESIKAVWDAVFKETSADINITANSTIPGECSIFTAYKIKNNQELWMLSGVHFAIFGSDMTMLNWQYINFIENYFAIHPINVSSWSFNESNISRRGLSNVEAVSEFNNYFENSLSSSANWQKNSTLGYNTYYFSNESNTTSYSIINLGAISGNYSLNQFSYIKVFFPVINRSCTPNWTEIRTTCNQSEYQLAWFNNSNNCSNYTTIPINQTRGCDYDQNGFMGNITQFLSGEKELYIDSVQINLSSKYNGTHSLEIKIGNASVEFSYNLSNSLDLTNITIQKQTPSSSFGYIIINGLDAQKIITIDKLINSSNSVCLRDAYVSSINNLSDYCNFTNEYLVVCPGNNSRYVCDITGDKFIISGVLHSALKEFTSNNSFNCVSSWNCTNWGACINNNKTRTCSNINNCQNATGKPAEQEACVSCTPSWNCTEWSSKNCSKTGNQTRICTDLNNCGINTGKPEEIKPCDKKNYKIWLLGLCLGVFLLIILLSFYLYRLSIKEKRAAVSISEESILNNEGNNENPQNIYK